MSNKLAKGNAVTQEKKSITRTLLEYMTVITGMAIAILVPLYLKDGYYGVGDCKFAIYKLIVILGLGILLLLLLFFFIEQEGACSEVIGALRKNPKEYLPELVLLAFLVLSLLSAVVGGNFSECVMGYNGWFMGLFSLTSFALLYFFNAFFGAYGRLTLWTLCIVSSITYVFGILHRLLIDPLGTYEGIADNYKNQFLSTMGQQTWYTSYVCTILPLGVAVFWCLRKTYLRILSGIFVFLGFCTIVTANADSAYMGFAGMMAVFLWVSALSPKRMERFCEVLLMSVAAPVFMKCMYLLKPNPIISYDAISRFLLFDNRMLLVVLLTLLLWVVFFFLSKKTGDAVSPGYLKGARLLRNAVFGLAFAMILAAIIILVKGAKGTLSPALRSIAENIPYLTWGENWGNGRGRTWELSYQMFKDMDVVHKLFGVGPDGFRPYAYNLYAERLQEMWGDRILTNAHNEILNSLISFGLIGVLSYMGFYGIIVYRFAKAWKRLSDKPEAAVKAVFIGGIACITSYLCHNFFCYMTVCCTPFLFLLLGVGMNLCRGESNES